MPRCTALLLLACLMAGIGIQSTTAKEFEKRSPPGKPAAASRDQAEVGELVVCAPIRYKNLMVFPIASKTLTNEDPYITLDEGLKSGTVQVYEVGAEPRVVPSPSQPSSGPQRTAGSGSRSGGASKSRQEPSQTAGRHQGSAQQADTSEDLLGDDPFAPAGTAQRRNRRPQPSSGRQSRAAIGDVNRLLVVNRSDKPLYLMPGEVVYGGQQDRTIAEEAIILADGKPTGIRVYCVEQGRWSSRHEAETSAALACLRSSSDQPLDARASQRLSMEAKSGKFVAPAGSLNKAARAAVQEGKGQHEVWKKVGEANTSSGVVSQSGAFTANYTSAEMGNQLRAYINGLQDAVANQRQVVGALVAINGKVEAVDVFQSTPLFKKLWPKLLKSHALDAAVAARKSEADKSCTVQEAKSFLEIAMHADTEKHGTSQGGLTVTKRGSKNVLSFSAAKRDASRRIGEAFGGAVHSAAFATEDK